MISVIYKYQNNHYYNFCFIGKRMLYLTVFNLTMFRALFEHFGALFSSFWGRGKVKILFWSLLIQINIFCFLICPEFLTIQLGRVCGGVGVPTDYLVAPVLNWTGLGCDNKNIVGKWKDFNLHHLQTSSDIQGLSNGHFYGPWQSEIGNIANPPLRDFFKNLIHRFFVMFYSMQLKVTTRKTLSINQK